ncbi:MAG TPA: hypothetical protein VES40_12980 [Ilumatobacteraceae bacterium]|nr:hypothetical protein [Ilumatobacteraceae bacterium]
MATDHLRPDRRRRLPRWATAALTVSLVACSSSDDDIAGRCDAITESIVAEAGGWSLVDVNYFTEADVCIYVLDSGELSVRFRDGDGATELSTGWLSLNDTVTSTKAEGSAVVELGIGDESYLINDTTAGAQTSDGTVVVSVQNGAARLDQASATTLLTAAVEALG